MRTRDIIVVGASAGGVQALIELVGSLPAGLPAAVLVVLHVRPHGTSRLPNILSRSGPLRAAHAEQGEPVVPGRIYVAPPDCHLQVREGRVKLTHGARENRARPAIDPLFRTAAQTYGRRVIGVILSGALADGSAGLYLVRTHGGITIVQDPGEALFGDMPRSALLSAGADHVLPVAGIGGLLARLAGEPAPERGTGVMSEQIEQAPVLIGQDFDEQVANRRGGEPSVYICPDCGGILWQMDGGRLPQFNCHVGHAYSLSNLLIQKSEETENALWACLRLMKEKCTLTRQIAERARQLGGEEAAAAIEEWARLDEKHIGILRESLIEPMPHPAAQALKVVEELEGTAGGAGDGGTVTRHG